MDTVKIISWNVNGLRAILDKNFYEFTQAYRPDILCLQETKIYAEVCPKIIGFKETYFNHCEIKKGYSGTAIFTQISPVSVRYLDVDMESMVNAVFEATEKHTLPNSFTVGIEDDLTHLSVPVVQSLDLEEKDCFRAIFYGLGSDGTVGANKNTIKIIGNETDRFVQAYFVYDSKKSGAMTVSHLRFGPNPIETPYLIEQANFVACHQFQFVDHYDILGKLQEGGIFLLNAPFAKEEVWRKLPQEVQKTILDKHIRFYAIDAYEVARKTGMGGRINTIMQTCFFAISGILPKDEAITCIKNAIKKTYGKKGDAVVQSNCAAVDATLEHLNCIEPGSVCSESHKRVPLNLKGGSEFIQNVTRMLLEQKGDQLPVSALPANGTWPTGT